MISNTSILFMIISLIIAWGLPLGLTIFLWVKQRISLLAVLVGALVFFVFQGLIRIPILQTISTMPWYIVMSSNPWLLGFFLAITAGLFEETGRWLAFRFLLRNKLELKNGLALGVGHGGFEAIFLVGLAYINNLVYSLTINNGTFDTTIGPALGGYAEQIKNLLIGTPSYLFLMGGLERAMTIAIQIALTLVVYFSVRYRKPALYWLAVALHFLLDFPAVVLPSLGLGIWFIEGFVLVCAAASLWFIFASKKFDIKLAAQEAPAVQA